jgi:uncharacterized protein (DUF1800 family)
MKFKPPLPILLLVYAIVIWFGLFRSLESLAANSNTLHLLNRLSFGPTPTEIQLVESLGVKTYLKSQLNPESIQESPQLEQKIATFTTLQKSPIELFQEYGPTKKLEELNQQERNKLDKNLRFLREEAINAHLLRSIASRRQLQEVMVDFWLNHFNFYFRKAMLTQLWIGKYEQDAIRPHALGKFRDLLSATAHHPVMLVYLDNWLNTDPKSAGAKGQFKGLNENYARELMELHTMGVDGGYTQQDIIALAKILTGWGIDRSGKRGDANGFYFWSNRHDFSDKIFLGKTIKGSGVKEVEQALDILARHPSTAHFISYKLAQYFIADKPPTSLVDRLTKSFQATDGDIRAVLTSLFDSPEFKDPQYFAQKFKTPYQYMISAARLIDIENPNLRKITGALIQLGMPVYGCPTPDGYKNTQEAWLNPDAMIRRVSWAIAISRGGIGISRHQKIDVAQLTQNLGNNFSADTKKTIKNSPPKLHAALILGSPEMMHR